MSSVYQIARWSEVFETSESRKLKRLTWVALPVAFESTGYQMLLDEFGDDAPALYGAWCALLCVAATANQRGILANSKGQPLQIKHIARSTGFPICVFEQLFTFASKKTVAWLLEVENCEKPLETGGKQDVGRLPAESAGASGENRAYLTRPNQTRHNITPPNQTVAEEAEEEDFLNRVVRLGWSMDDLKDKGKRFRKRSKTTERMVPTDLMVAVLIVDALVDSALCGDVCARIATGEINRPARYLRASVTRALRDASESHTTEQVVGVGREFVALLKNEGDL